MNLYKLSQLDYLHVCDLTRKIYRCFDLDGNANLDKFETRHLIDAFSSEMNTIGTSFNKQSFREWFAQIDASGDEMISLQELIQALCQLLKVEIPEEAVQNSDIPQKLIQKHQQIQSQLKKFQSHPEIKKDTVRFGPEI